MEYTITQSRLLYVYSIGDKKHRGLLKVGEVFVDNDTADNRNMQALAGAVRDVLNKRPYMKDVTYKMEYVECTTYAQQTGLYTADDVHRKLRAMGRKDRMLGKLNREAADIWFECTVPDVRQAIEEIKAGRGAGYGDIKFRPEQEWAIRKTVDYFTKEYKETDKGKRYLWNAKMRFGKTLSGLEVARRCGYRSTLIITHRPVVDSGWREDFEKIFCSRAAKAEYEAKGLKPAYGRRMEDEGEGDFYTLTQGVKAGNTVLVFFVSMQYLRLSQYIGGKERTPDPLKEAIMKYDWDFVMVDEAHEGIDANIGKRVMEKLKKDNTRILSLSGTPFNLLEKYDEGEIYTWDYVMEQRAKHLWDEHHFGDPNPYADLPRMQILTFHLPKMLRDQAIENNETFRFHEFFRVWTEADKKALQTKIDEEEDSIKKAELEAQLGQIVVDRFVHEDAIRRFLDKLVETSPTSRYPFSKDEFREHFRHTFWLLPGVKEAAALEKLLKEHEVFGSGMFHIINVAGDGNIEDKDGNALKEVLNNIRGNEAAGILPQAYTITLSCGKLTTGVSVPEWTAMLNMKGSEKTGASSYMQSIFRVQTHAVIEGRQKTDCYVFDFDPDRALTAVAEAAKMTVGAQQGKGKGLLKQSQKEEEEHLEAFIKLCPVLSMDEGEMGRQISATQIFEKLNNVYIERAVRSGYSDNSLYNPDMLLDLSPEQEKALDDVHGLLGKMPNLWKPEKITINRQGLGDINKDADDVKYIYYLSASAELPAKPKTAKESDSDGRPTTSDEGWGDEMTLPTPLWPYLYVSHSQHIRGVWTSFSKPRLWKEWSDPNKKKKSEEQEERDKKNKEKRARMSVLRGVSIRIPLLVYGANINDEKGEEITIDNFTSLVDDPSWEEFMPRGFTKEMFNLLKDCFDRNIFTGAAKRIRAMVKEADNLSIEDRIAKIATIFSYFHNPDKETVLTPWRVVNMQLSDTLGGWCFFDETLDNPSTEERYDEPVSAPRFVDRGQVTTDVFRDSNARILEINSKTGLYPLYMAYSLFREAKEPLYRNIELTGERGQSRNAEQYYSQAGNDLVIWDDVLKDNIFVVCHTPMAALITRRTLAGFRKDVRMNVKCYEHEVSVNDLVAKGVLKATDEGVTKEGKTYRFEGKTTKNCEMINVLRARPDFFQDDVVKGTDFWQVYNSIPLSKQEDINNMKFQAIVGNPPYQVNDGGGTGSSSIPVYQYFVSVAKTLEPNYVSIIIPAKWYTGGKKVLDDFRSTMLNDNHICTLVDFDDSRDCFPTVDIAGGVCYFLWNSKYNGSCEIISVHGDTRVSVVRPLGEHETFVRDTIALQVIKKVQSEHMLDDIVFSRKPFGFSSFYEGTKDHFEGAVELFGSKGISYVHREDVSTNYDLIDRWKLIMSKTAAEHAGQADKNGQRRVLSRIEVLKPGAICSETYLLLNTFDDEQSAINMQTYMKTRFVRFLLSTILLTQNIAKDKFKFVPLQDFTSSSDIDWSKSIEEIDEKLFDKYGLEDAERAFIRRMIKPME